MTECILSTVMPLECDAPKLPPKVLSGFIQSPTEYYYKRTIVCQGVLIYLMLFWFGLGQQKVALEFASSVSCVHLFQSDFARPHNHTHSSYLDLSYCTGFMGDEDLLKKRRTSIESQQFKHVAFGRLPGGALIVVGPGDAIFLRVSF